MLAHELAGTQDAELTQLLIKLFHESGKDSDLRIRQLFLIGSTETAGQLLTELRAAHPRPYQQDITQLLEDLSSFGFARDLTLNDVNGRIMPADPTEHLPHEAFLDPKEQVRTTLETAGLRVGVDMVMDLSDQMAVFSEMANGEFDVDLLHIDEHAKYVYFRYEGRVFRYAVPYPEEYQHPLVESAIANAVLSQRGTASRFVAYGNYQGMSEIDFYFGPYQLAKRLEDEYDVGFISGWESSFDSPQVGDPSDR